MPWPPTISTTAPRIQPPLFERTIPARNPTGAGAGGGGGVGVGAGAEGGGGVGAVGGTLSVEHPDSMTARTIHANLTVGSTPLPRITLVVASLWTLTFRQVIRVPW